MVIRKTSIENGVLIGEGERGPDATTEAYGYYHPQTKRVEIPLAEVETLEIYEDDKGVSTVLVGGVAVMMVVIAVLSPAFDAY